MFPYEASTHITDVMNKYKATSPEACEPCDVSLENNEKLIEEFKTVETVPVALVKEPVAKAVAKKATTTKPRKKTDPAPRTRKTKTTAKPKKTDKTKA